MSLIYPLQIDPIEQVLLSTHILYLFFVDFLLKQSQLRLMIRYCFELHDHLVDISI
jgi:hypothetical protein